jgi:hypothetical protein
MHTNYLLGDREFLAELHEESLQIPPQLGKHPISQYPTKDQHHQD